MCEAGSGKKAETAKTSETGSVGNANGPEDGSQTISGYPLWSRVCLHAQRWRADGFEYPSPARIMARERCRWKSECIFWGGSARTLRWPRQGSRLTGQEGKEGRSRVVRSGSESSSGSRPSGRSSVRVGLVSWLLMRSAARRPARSPSRRSTTLRAGSRSCA